MRFKDNNKEYDIKFEEIHNRYNGIVQASFTLNVSRPFKAESRFTDGDITTLRGVKGINFYKSSNVAKAAYAAAGAKKQDVLFSLTDEALQYITSEAEKGNDAIQNTATQKEIKTWVWALGGDTHNLYLSTDDFESLEMHFRDDLKEIRNYIINNDGRATMEFLRDHSQKITRETALYTVSGWYEISHTDIMDIYNKIKAEADEIQKAKGEKRQVIFDKAAKTDKPQILRRWSDECCDPREECDLDNIIEYAMPDGTVKTERHHTW